ncbi:hypothetical protein L485_03260 [Sphingobium baderi LL03]|uniref:Uncharacterized protein n=1 Tax=Sphingobium baderi LL03 TaxID=1114964 RepID=T0I0I0_9SPHN|nr:hypothetical protein L485_03260 [Sphingobium baderi LL03]
MAAQSPQKAVSALSRLCGCAGMPAQCKSDAAAIVEGAAVAAHCALMPRTSPMASSASSRSFTTDRGGMGAMPSLQDRGRKTAAKPVTSRLQE